MTIDNIFDDVIIASRGVNLETFEQVIYLAVELAREGREGRKIGALFVLGDHEEVLARSRALILDPLLYHPESDKQIQTHNMWETVKELAQLDGAFVVSDAGVVVSACRYINASSEGVELALGLGSRHMAAASITKETEAVAVVVSESAIVRVFDDGELVSEIIPELLLLKRYGLHLEEPYTQRVAEGMTVVSKQVAILD